MKKIYFMLILLPLLGCTQRKKAELIVYNAWVYTVDTAFSVAESFAVKEGKIIATGTNDYILSHYESDQTLDAEGKYIYPGFIDAHCHFYGYGLSLQSADLTGTRSYDEVIQVLKKFYDDHHPAWLTGRGWDQNDWTDKSLPDNSKLDQIFPDVPVLITRIDGHAALANTVALKIAGITAHTKVEGGQIKLSGGKPTGLLIDNAIDLVTKHIPPVNREQQIKALIEAQRNCFASGLTAVADAGLDKEIILLIDELQKAGKLKIKIYAMLNPTEENFSYFMNRGHYITDRLRVSSVKLYADGALGSRGACLLEPYSDDAGNYGIMVTSADEIKRICLMAYKQKYQVNVHAIGDSAVRTVLKIFAEILKKPNDLRWRIEHAQCVAPQDFSLFGKYNIIPSVQPTHATSDMYWAAKRLGEKRIKTAYAYAELLKQNNWIAFGTDFPVEKISPLLTFYAAVFRKDEKGFPDNGWQTENAVSREQALKAMTLWAAKACFISDITGSIENGKCADFVILDRDIMTSSPQEILSTKVIATYVNGKKVFPEEE